jgi:F-type H+-transporting ATPase subunit alpha
MIDIKTDEISALLEKELLNFASDNEFEEIGSVLQVNDSVVRIYGLDKVSYGELVVFPNGTNGLVLNLEEGNVGAVVLGESSNIKEGDIVKRTGKVMSVKVGKGLLGRVINTLVEPIDGKGEITGTLYDMPIERKSPGVIYREPVTIPLQTGIKAIDSMIPIGRGQRELIIGDRQTGKSSIAVDIIINQKRFFDKGDPVYCIYVAIGKKSSTVANLVAELEKHGAMAYTTVVVASSADPATIQYIAPFTGTVIGEFFRDTGMHALVIYDDLSKQAIAYREISLLLRRPPGREAYPGDIFYLHSRLLERSAKIISSDEVARNMNDLPKSLVDHAKGGGSLTALPIIETQSGDVSAYIPTNVISITDGQIFLESNLFNSGVKPAINVGISVSRVGGAAQFKCMKKVAGVLKLAQAQFRELESFSKFGSDLDLSTKKFLNRGKVNQQMLNQTERTLFSMAEQVAIISVCTSGCLDDIPLEKVSEFEKLFLELLNAKHSDLMAIVDSGQINDVILNVFKTEAAHIVDKYIINK